MLTVVRLWEGLRRVRSVRFVACGVTPGWDGIGEGIVAVDTASSSVLTYMESGIWRPTRGSETRFTNVFRWTLVEPELVRLDHLRLGPNHPVYLFDLAPGIREEWASVRPHL